MLYFLRLYARVKIYLLLLVDSSSSHSRTDTHGHDTEFVVRSLVHLVKKSGGHTSTGSSERVTQSDRSSVNVNVVPGQAELLDAVGSLGGKGLVNLPQIDVLHVQASALDSSRDGSSRTDTHDVGSNTCNVEGLEVGDDRHAQLLGLASLHDQDCGGSIGNLRGVSGGGGTSLLKGSLQLTQALHLGTGAHTAVGIEDDFLESAGLLVLDLSPHWDDLVLEAAGLDGVGGAGVRANGELILLLAGDVELFGDVLGGDSHRHHAVLSLLVHEHTGVGGEALLKGHSGHVLDTHCQTNVIIASFDGSGDRSDSLQT